MNVDDVQNCEDNDPLKLLGFALEIQGQASYGKRSEKAIAMTTFFWSFICNGRTSARTSMKMPISIVESTTVMTSQRRS